MLKHAIGIRAYAPENEVVWHINKTDRHGIKNLTFGEGNHRNSISLIAAKRLSADDNLQVNASCLQPFTLKVISYNNQYRYKIHCDQASSKTVLDITISKQNKPA
ncbi:hypothetical protein [Thalassomonas actiniarum]|uniref:Uncharacterized protein n=1 Tax=Thalassomonas actiniarum TaxID=485447 RepID=A0AAE9YMD8_9GAMM|nr:hypothetical protein [Thalassomonas actiniarum]WDD97557.1 hypothetical protein SG35_019865 [Thalassomonas actiniarum]